MTTVILNKFNGGQTNDPRNSSIYSQLCKHFDNFTRSHALEPYKDIESALSTQSTKKLERFLTYNSKLYAYGLSAGGFAQVFETSDITSANTLAESTTAADSAGTPSFDIFVEYNGVLYGATAGNRIWSYTISSNTFAGTTGGGGISYTNLGGALVHSKDDILYLAIDNKIYYKDGAGNIALGLTLPANLIITSICEYGNYLSIGCKPLYQNATNSRVFLWDRDVTLTTTSESIDWGNNDLLFLENLDGYLVGVSFQLGQTLPSKLVFQKYAGGGAIKFNELPIASYTVFKGKQKYNNRLYFGVGATSYINKTTGSTGDYTAIWAVGRNGENEPFSVNIDRMPNNDTLASRVNGFLLVGEYVYISYILADLSTYGLSKTRFQQGTSTTSKWQSVVNPGMPEYDKALNKKLVGVRVLYEAPPTLDVGTAQLVLKYKVDGGSFTTVFTDTTLTAKFMDWNDANGVPFTDGREYEFFIDSNRVTVTALIYNYEPEPTTI